MSPRVTRPTAAALGSLARLPPPSQAHNTPERALGVWGAHQPEQGPPQPLPTTEEQPHQWWRERPEEVTQADTQGLLGQRRVLQVSAEGRKESQAWGPRFIQKRNQSRYGQEMAPGRAKKPPMEGCEKRLPRSATELSSQGGGCRARGGQQGSPAAHAGLHTYADFSCILIRYLKRQEGERKILGSRPSGSGNAEAPLARGACAGGLGLGNARLWPGWLRAGKGSGVARAGCTEDVRISRSVPGRKPGVQQAWSRGRVAPARLPAEEGRLEGQQWGASPLQPCLSKPRGKLGGRASA